MITTILVILLILIWVVGAVIVTAFTGWELNKISDLIKIIFWFISVFIGDKKY